MALWVSAHASIAFEECVNSVFPDKEAKWEGKLKTWKWAKPKK